ncbi:MAG: Nif3-like dinuclear metal center hexameric protein [Clostridia bacterium]|nr:Nif3-like dinuclear metal center hexameric protein [Clostridia bacterium]
MIKVKEIINYLDCVFPINTACDFDNVGLLVGDENSETNSVVVALDCDVNTFDFAIQNGANLIITHHPVIFDPLKSVKENDIVFLLIKNGISVISMHTNLDVGDGGVNDTLCEYLGLTEIKPYTTVDGYLLKYGRTDKHSADEFALHIKNNLGGFVRYVAGKTPINTVLVCSGSGGSYLDEAIVGGFDAYVTADVKQNHFISAINAGISLFDGGHFSTENIIVEPLCKRLKAEFPNTAFTAYMPDSIKTV